MDIERHVGTRGATVRALASIPNVDGLPGFFLHFDHLGPKGRGTATDIGCFGPLSGPETLSRVRPMSSCADVLTRVFGPAQSVIFYILTHSAKVMSDGWEVVVEVVSKDNVRTTFEAEAPNNSQPNRNRYRTVDKGTGKEYINESRIHAHAVGILIDEYSIDPQKHSDDCIPIDIVTDGNPAIVAYLLGALGYSRRRVCDTLDISNQTVSKYIARIRR